MSKHIVMWPFMDGVLGQSSQAHAIWMKQHLEALMDEVPEIKQIEVGVNTSKSPMAYDAELTLVVDDAEALQRYRLHPEHQKISQHCHEVRSSRTVVDYII